MKHREQSLGRPAVFLLPSLKLKSRDKENRTIEERVHAFLLEQYGGYSAFSGTTTGHWKDDAGVVFYGEHRQYTVSFVGKERIPALKDFLGDVCKMINEQCIYLQTGEDSFLIYPGDE